MSRARFLQKDLLAKAMTRGTRILGVPFNFALNNIALFMTLMLVFYTVTQKAVCLMVAIGGMTISHIVMMILSLKEEHALKMIFSNFSLCASTPFDDTQSYTPLTSTIKRPAIKERSSKKHLPWTHLYNQHTVMTKKGELLQVLTLEGISFHTEEGTTLDDNKNLRNRLLYQMASPSIAISFYTIRRKQALYPEGEYEPGFACDFNARYKAQMTSSPRYQNALYIVLLHKAPAFSKGIKKPRRHNEDIKMQRAWHDKALKTLNEQSSRIISLFKKENCRRLGSIQEHYAASELLSFLSELTNLEPRVVRQPLQALNTYLATKSHHFAKRRGIIQIRSADGSSKYAAMLSLKEYPEETSACLLDSLLSANCELILTQSFFFKHNQPALKALQTQQRKMTKTDDSILLADAIDLSIEELKAGIAAYGEHHLSICVIARDIESLDKGIYEIESKLNQEAGLILAREEQGVELAFWAQLPGNHAYRIRHSLINSLNVASLANLHNYPLGQAHGNHWGEAITVLETL
ncbi:MAG: hypothetical protein K2X39_03380, partial [Silvanigrellaceae bacterium]|nr:hypothetical protein [Silvanigrellaceae bacterium]